MGCVTPVALITGGNRGLGRETARRLASEGLSVVIGSRLVDAGSAAADELAAAGDVRAVQLDVTDETSVLRAVEFIADTFGVLDVLVNNAGRIIEEDALTTTAEQMSEVFATNVFGVATVIRATLPLLARSESPRIVNVCSTTGSLSLTAAGTDFGGVADRRLAYSTSKAALNMLTLQYDRALRRHPELQKIRINAVTPGYTATDTNENQGTRSVEEGATIIVDMAMQRRGDVSGGFFRDTGRVSW